LFRCIVSEMEKFRNKYRIPSARLKGFDYSQNGLYFITINTNNHQSIFGNIIDGSVDNIISPKMILSEAGIIVSDCWYDLPNHYPNIILDEFIIMPDHIHGIIKIENSSDIKTKHGLSEFIRAFKSFSSRRINELRKTKKPDIWQQRFYDRIIRSNIELNNIRLYIKNNLVKNSKNAI
jgi:putative transposase